MDTTLSGVSVFQELPWLGPALAAAWGLIWGSFVNVLIYRLPRDRSVVFPSSACPSCGKAIAPYDNVPVLSYLLLLGRCRLCGAGIPFRYPAVELLVMAASLTAYLRHGFGTEYAVELGFVVATLALIFIDYDHRILPNVITIPGTLIGLLLALFREPITLTEALIGAALGAGLLFGVAEVYFRVRRVEGLGMGDVKMMAMVGAFLGWKGVLLTLFAGSLVGSLVGVALMVTQGKDMKTALPFGTFLGIAALLTLFAGAPLIDWYFDLF
ncbi:MAG TPA: A24 family peptidase [Vicinamibacteria bacterium]|nr:A24 family peptidase [Vicinamibacteria bacterium]